MSRKASANEGAANLAVLFDAWRRRLVTLGLEHGTPAGTSWDESEMERVSPEVFGELLALGREMDGAFRQSGYPQPGEVGATQVLFLYEWMRLSRAAAFGVCDELLWEKMPLEQGREMITLLVSMAQHITQHGLTTELSQLAQELFQALFLAYWGQPLPKLALEQARASENKTTLQLVEESLKQHALLLKKTPSEAVGWLAQLGLDCAEKDLPSRAIWDAAEGVLALFNEKSELGERVYQKLSAGEPLTPEEETFMQEFADIIHVWKTTDRR